MSITERPSKNRIYMSFLCPNIWKTHPIFVARIYQLIAELFNMPLRQLAAHLAENIKNLYHLQ
jgi:Tat protein secretion system quality control protein TatD with DNase activity